jgi:hypothetical protein
MWKIFVLWNYFICRVVTIPQSITAYALQISYLFTCYFTATPLVTLIYSLLPQFLCTALNWELTTHLHIHSLTNSVRSCADWLHSVLTHRLCAALNWIQPSQYLMIAFIDSSSFEIFLVSSQATLAFCSSCVVSQIIREIQEEHASQEMWSHCTQSYNSILVICIWYCILLGLSHLCADFCFKEVLDLLPVSTSMPNNEEALQLWAEYEDP